MTTDAAPRYQEAQQTAALLIQRATEAYRRAQERANSAVAQAAGKERT